jgi:hypothetical protein
VSTEAERHRRQQQPDDTARLGEHQQRRAREQATDEHDRAGFHPAQHRATRETGKRREHRDPQHEHTREPDGQRQIAMHPGPRHAHGAIGQSQAHEAQIDDGKQ